MNRFEPSEFPRRILLVVSGMSPQIMTETLFALTQMRTPAFIPTEVHILTTASGARNARLSLLKGEAHFLRLCEEYDLDPAMFSEKNIHCIQKDGHPLDDIRSVAENECAADCITQTIRDFTNDENSALHVSMAGGRKTMGYYAGYALSLYGREQDRLSHVLVTEGFEGHRDFYYPTRESRAIYRDQQVLDAREAQVTLAEIPFVRLRSDIPNTLLEGRASFSETIARAQMAQQRQTLLIDLENLVFKVGDISLNSLGGANLAFMVWLVQRKLDGKPSIESKTFRGEFNTELGQEFIDVCEALWQRDTSLERSAQEGSAEVDSEQKYRNLFAGISKVVESLKYGLDQQGFWNRRTDLNKALQKVLGNQLAQSFLLQNSGPRGKSSYGFIFEDDQVDWRPFP